MKLVAFVEATPAARRPTIPCGVGAGKAGLV